MLCEDRKVTLMEDSDQNIHLKNLSSHQASNEEEALNLLFLGDTNRMIAEVTTITAPATTTLCSEKNTLLRFLLYLRGKCLDFCKIFRECSGGNLYFISV